MPCSVRCWPGWPGAPWPERFVALLDQMQNALALLAFAVASLMLARFGADYAAYQRSTPQLISRPRRI